MRNIVFYRYYLLFLEISSIALEADRFSVSNRAAASISTATLVDYGIISSSDSTLVIDHHKVWRARQKLRRNFKKSCDCH